jgi:hypothetical protein
VFVDPIQTSMSFSVPTGQCHVPTHSTIVNLSIGSIKLDPAALQVGGLQFIIAVTSPKHRDHSRLKDTLVPPTCQKSQLHMSLDQKHKKLGNGRKKIWAWVLLLEKR